MHVRTQSLLQAVLINKAKLMSAQFLRTVMIIHIIEDFRLSSVNKREVYCDISFFKVSSLISCFSGLNSSKFEFQGEDILFEEQTKLLQMLILFTNWYNFPQKLK